MIEACYISSELFIMTTYDCFPMSLNYIVSHIVYVVKELYHLEAWSVHECGA